MLLLSLGCNINGNNGGGDATPAPTGTAPPENTPEVTTPPGDTSAPTSTPDPTSVPTAAPEYSVTISVVNNDTNEYRLYIGTSDDLYDADAAQVDLSEGEIVIASIVAGTTESYVLDLGTNPTLAKDWLLQYYNTFFLDWSLVYCTPNIDGDGYIFTGDESYTITIESIAAITIAQDS